MNQPIVRRVDHLIIRADGAAHARLHYRLSDELGLPTPWPVSEHPAFTSAGIFAGNVDFELLDLKQPSRNGSAEAGGSSNTPAAARFMFDTVYRDGIVFAVKYNPAWRDIDAERLQSEGSFCERDGGRLGLVRVASVQWA